MRQESLRLGRLTVVHGGERTFALGKGVQAVAAGDLLKELAPYALRPHGRARFELFASGSTIHLRGSPRSFPRRRRSCIG